MLLPALAAAKQKAMRVACASNLKQVYLGFAMYGEDNSDLLPPKFEIKKNTLKGEDILKGKQLQSLESGLHTILARYVGGRSIDSLVPGENPAARVFRCPSDRGDYGSNVPVFDRKGSSYKAEGSELNRKEGDEYKNRFSMASTRDVVRDLFKPWDVDDPLKVMEKVAKGELGPIRWHSQFYHKVMGDGHVVAVRSKSEDKLSKGETDED